jgi:hypothetical protein
MGIPVKLAIMVITDIIGKMFKEEDASSGVRAKDIETRYHFIEEHVEDVFIKVVIFKTEDNNTDLCTKNLKKGT